MESHLRKGERKTTCNGCANLVSGALFGIPRLTRSSGWSKGLQRAPFASQNYSRDFQFWKSNEMSFVIEKAFSPGIFPHVKARLSLYWFLGKFTQAHMVGINYVTIIT